MLNNIIKALYTKYLDGVLVYRNWKYQRALRKNEGKPYYVVED